jgi:hypothetical protein
MLIMVKYSFQIPKIIAPIYEIQKKPREARFQNRLNEKNG